MRKKKKKIQNLGTAKNAVVGGVYKVSDGTLVQCVVSHDCSGCYYDESGIRTDDCMTVICGGSRRKDGCDVKFVRYSTNYGVVGKTTTEDKPGTVDDGCLDAPILESSFEPQVDKCYRTKAGVLVRCVHGDDCNGCVFASKLDGDACADDCETDAGRARCKGVLRDDNTNVKFVPVDSPSAHGEEQPARADGEQLQFLPYEPEPGKVYRTAEGIVVNCVESNDCRDCVFCSVLNEKGIADDCKARCCNIVACASGPRQDKKDVKFVRVQDSRYEEEQYPVLPEEPEIGKVYRLTDGRLVKCEEQPDGVDICKSCALSGCGCINTLCCASDRKDEKTVFFPELKDAAGGAGSDVPAQDIVQDTTAACSMEEVSASVPADEASTLADVMVKIRQQEERLGMLGYDSCGAVQKLVEARLTLGGMLADAVLKDRKGGAE